MSSIAPGPLQDIQAASDPIVVSQFNFEVITRDLYKFTPSYQNGVVTAVIGPPTSGDHLLDEIWKDSKNATYRCTVAGTPGTWRQELPAVMTGLPDQSLYPTGYRLVDAGDAGRFYTKIGSVWTSAFSSSSDIISVLAGRGIQGGIYWYDSVAGIASTSALTGILKGAGTGGPTVIAGLTAGRVAAIGAAGATLSNSIIRDNGARCGIGADIDGGELVLQVTGGISLMGASTLRTSVGELTLNTGNSLSINFKIGGSNGWKIRSDSILESIGAQTVRSSTGDLTIGTGAANGNVYISPHGRGAFIAPRLSTASKNLIAPVVAGMIIFDTTLGKFCIANNALAWETVTSV